MESLLEIASQIRTPLALAAVTLILLFGLLRSIIQKGRYLKLIIQGVLLLAVMTSILAIIAYIWDSPTTFRGFKQNVSDGEHDDLLHRRVVLEAKEQPFRDVVMSLSRQIGAVAAIGPDLDLDGKVTIYMDGRLSAVMDELCNHKGCSWWIQEGKPQPALVVQAKGTAPTG